MKVEESLNVTFDESPPPTKLSPLVDDDVGEEEAIRKNTKIVNTNNEEDESIEVDEIVNIKESKNHPLDQVIGNLNQRTLRSQAQNHSNFFCFISTIEPKNVNEALKDESWVVAMQEELNQFVANDVWELVPLPISQSVIGTKWVFRNKLDENGLESIRILLAIACANDFKLYQMDVKSAFLNGFINKEIKFRRTSLTGFPAQSIRSSNAIALDSPYLLVLITGTSQSKQHVDTSLICIQSRKSPTKSLFNVGSRRISIVTVNTKEYHSDVLAIIT
ncbi:retrovirus-related pol polyprotein from transposon TNT 1-94 [Tanacetum coccineum]